MNIKQICEILDGKLIGDESTKIVGLCDIEDPKENTITFAASKKFYKKLKDINIAAVIVPEEIDISIPQIIVKNPYYSFSILLKHFHPYNRKYNEISEKSEVSKDSIVENSVGIGPFVTVESNTEIGENTEIYPGCYIGSNVKIGKNCRFYSNVSIYSDTEIGDNVIIHSGTVLGSDGYGFVLEKGEHKKIPQVGKVIIEDSVEIGANCTIDRPCMGETKVGEGTKMDNMIHLGHNVELGKRCLVVAQVGIAGSSKVGNYVTLAGQVGLTGHLSIGDNTVVASRSVVMNNIKPGSFVSGFPAIDHKRELKIKAITQKLPEIYSEIKKLIKR